MKIGGKGDKEQKEKEDDVEGRKQEKKKRPLISKLIENRCRH